MQAPTEGHISEKEVNRITNHKALVAVVNVVYLALLRITLICV